MLFNLLALALAVAAPAHADDWLLDAQRGAAAAMISGSPAPEAPKSDWISYEPISRLFRAELPPEGWHPFEEEDALGSVIHILGPDDPSGAFRTTLTVRLVDRDSPNFIPIKDAVDAMRREAPGRETTAMHTLRVEAGLARVFEVMEARRMPADFGPSVPMDVHQYVAVVPRGEAYFVVRLITSRESYLEFRDVFIRFLRSLRPIGGR